MNVARMAAISLTALAAWAAGCRQAPVSRFAYQDIRLEVSGRVEGPAAGAEELTLKAALSTGSRDGTLVDVRLWDAEHGLRAPAEARDLSYDRPSVATGYSYGGGFYPHGFGDVWYGFNPHRYRAHGVGPYAYSRYRYRGYHPYYRPGPYYYDSYDRRPKFDLPFGFPRRLADGRAVTRVRARFTDLPPRADGRYILVTVALRRSDGRTVLRPLLLPTAVTTNPEAEPAEPGPLTERVAPDEGPTVVLAGLAEAPDRPAQRAPILRDVPALHERLRSPPGASEREEMVVFVAPRVLLLADEPE